MKEWEGMVALSDGAHIVGAFMGYQGIARQALLAHKGDLKPSQIMILNLLEMNEQINMSALANQLAISKEQASRVITYLVENGYVERAHDRSNRRVVNVSLTDRGRELVNAFREAYDDSLLASLDKLDEEEKKEFVQISRRAAELLRKALS